ncbi:serine--tRNA ligase [Candidatus Parcubacteria bacterium]|nr:MAG: serine--tRNA ligase [Candidatus Parcubacteria bacterium]
MLDIKLLREEPEKVKKAIATKRADPKLVDAFLELDGEWRKLTQKIDELRAEQKKLSSERSVEAAKKNKEAIKEYENKIVDIEKEREFVWIQIPNIPDADVPVGSDETGNKVIRKQGEPKKYSFKPKEHLELGEALDIIDVERAGKISGTRFGYLKGGAALLEFALIQHALEVLRDEKILKSLADKVEKGYPAKPFIPVVPPVMIRPDVYRKTGRLGPGDEDEKYYIPRDDMYLIGSAEHTLAPLHMDEVLSEGDLPIRYVGFSTSFRREAGSYGKDTKGILRVHQFDKLEIESFTTAENSRKEQDFIVSIQEYLMQSLEIPYQVVAICTGDMGGPDIHQIDIEAWLPGQPSSTGSGQGRYRETHTSDLIGDYQARRLGTKVKRAGGKTELVHMNDATVFAIGRAVIAILENYQTKDGTIEVPKVLQKYVGEKIIRKSSDVG